MRSRSPQETSLVYKKEILSLANKLGIPVSTRNPQDSYSWDGKTMAVNDWKIPISNVLHDIAHWLVSTPERRLIPDFGLGTGPDSGLFIKEFVSDPTIEEMQASCLGILYEKVLGLGWEYTFKWHSWDNDGEFEKQISLLEERGLVCNGMPTTLP